MKKIFLLTITLALMSVGCGKPSITSIQNTPYTQNDNILYKSEYGTTYTYDLPFQIEYGSGRIECQSIKLYQEKSDHGYYIFPVLYVNLDSLSEDDKYWLSEEMSISLLIDNVQNNIENEHLSILCNYTDYNGTYFIFDANDEYKNSFDQANISIFFDIDNGTTRDSYMFSSDVETIDTKELDSGIYQAMSDALDSRLEFLKNFLN